MSRTFSIVGLGKLGASMAAGIASRGHQVVGVDVSRSAVERVNAGHAPVQETGLDELINANRERIRATDQHEDAILNSELTFVIVPTPSDERGAFSLQYASFAFREIGKALAKKQGYHTVVLTSTVLPGATRYGLLPILERHSGKVCGRDFGSVSRFQFSARAKCATARHRLLDHGEVLGRRPPYKNPTGVRLLIPRERVPF